MNISFCLSAIVLVSLLYPLINLTRIGKHHLAVFFKQFFTFFSVVFGLIALEIGGSMMLGTCQEAYSIGIYGLLYVVGISVGFLLLGFGFAAKMKAMNVESTMDLFEIKYKSPLIRTSASLLSIVTVWGLLLGQIIATKSLIHALGIKNDYIFVGVMFLVILYAIVGGLRAAGITWQAQLIYTILVFGGIFGFCLFMEPPSAIPTLFLNRVLFPESTINFTTIFSSVVMPALYYITDQEFAKPLFETSNKCVAATAALCASFFMLLFSLVPIYFGIKAKMLGLSIPDDMSPLIPVLSILTNGTIVFLAVCGMAAALIAMIDYYLWSVSLSITHELGLAHSWFKDNNRFDKFMVFIVGLVALIGTYCTTSSAIQILLYSYELYDSCLIVPLTMSYFQSDLKKGSAIGAIIFGLSGFIIFQIISVSFSGQIASLLLSLIGFYCGGLVESCITKLKAIKRSHTCSV